MARDRRENPVREKCWPYEKSETPSFPIVDVKLRSPRIGQTLPRDGRLRLKMDTGYAGELMLSTDLYNRGFQLVELPEANFGRYRTVAGIVEVKRARGIIEIPELEVSMQAIVETPRNLRFDRNLAGRGFLKNFWLILKGAEAELCARTGQ